MFYIQLLYSFCTGVSKIIGKKNVAIADRHISLNLIIQVIALLKGKLFTIIKFFNFATYVTYIYSFKHFPTYSFY